MFYGKYRFTFHNIILNGAIIFECCEFNTRNKSSIVVKVQTVSQALGDWFFF